MIDRQPITAKPGITPCQYLSGPDMGFEDTDTIEDYADWCIRSQDERRLTDGTGYARMQAGGLITAKSAISQNVREGAGKRPAEASEVLEAWHSLRLMTEAEVRVNRPLAYGTDD
ncbi:MAG: hypothetical protein JWM51_1732 [Microbacteriaceae bacterium]|nr:hypothetical protein [Microbacteriaceae bacterium]